MTRPTLHPVPIAMPFPAAPSLPGRAGGAPPDIHVVVVPRLADLNDNPARHGFQPVATAFPPHLERE